jgi:DNA-binding Lrp family transcriptional regulator
MRTHQLDAIDVRILTALQARGRATNIEIAASAQLTAPPTLRRTRTVEEQGVIRRYHAVLDGKKLGFEVAAFIAVRLASQTQDHVRRFEIAMGDLDAVRECHALTGARDYLLKCVFRDLASSQAFVTDTLLRTDNILSVNTLYCIRTSKHEPNIPLELIDASAPPAAARKLRLPPLPHG